MGALKMFLMSAKYTYGRGLIAWQAETCYKGGSRCMNTVKSTMSLASL